jgi:DNA-binding GntR family transcriptional regulator
MRISGEGTSKWGACLRWVKERIDDGTYPEGAWLPLITEVASALNMSTFPVRQALAALEKQKIITRVHQEGWYVGRGPQPRGTSPANQKRSRQGRAARAR